MISRTSRHSGRWHAIAALVGTPLLANGVAAAPTATLEPPPPGRIIGGSEVPECAWPTTVHIPSVAKGTCTGTLVHPQLVVYAAHCGPDLSGPIRMGEDRDGGGRDLQVEFCRSYPGYQFASGVDWGFCKLAEPVTDVPIAPPLMGCETEILTPGREVVLVGFGYDESSRIGRKRMVTTTLNELTSKDEASIGAAGQTTCNGDSGGPAYVQLSADAGGDDTWRVFGITSWGFSCSRESYSSLIHVGMPWIEQESGVDVSPCHDADGTWNPGPRCHGFAMAPDEGGGRWATGCEGGELGGWSNACGPQFDAAPDDDAPTVAIEEPIDGARFDSDPETGKAPIDLRVFADDGDGWGIREVQLIVDGQDVHGGKDAGEPYEFRASFPPGVYELSARATDYADNSESSMTVVIGVDRDPPVPAPDDSGDPSPEHTGGSDEDSGGEDDPTGAGTGGGEQDSDGSEAAGCGCTTTKSPSAAFALVVVVVAFRRARRPS